MNALAVVLAVVTGLTSGAGAAWIGGRVQRPKIKAEAEQTAVDTAVTMLHELRVERDEMRGRITELETCHSENVRAIDELRSAERKCLTRLRRAVQAMRDNGLHIPADIDL